MSLRSTKIVMIIAFFGYQDKEYGEPKKIFEENKIEVATVSSQLGEAKGKLGGTAKIDFLLENLEVKNFDAIIFVGGPGAKIYQDDAYAHKAARDAVRENKVLGAICIAPTILAKAGVLQSKKATVWSNFSDKKSIEILEKNGAIFVDQEVVKDGKIITANGPEAVEEFAQTIVNVLK